jgi:tRNA pseudouridine55 synthase
MNGILIFDKPAGLTSAEIVRRVKARIGGKVGHLGTLDPFATGVLPLCVGEGTKIAQFLNASDKRYEGVIRLGSATDTGDRSGAVVRTTAVPDLSDEDIERVAHAFTGPILQVPPMYSAIKRSGVPLYRLARKGIEVEREARPVRIAYLRLEARSPGTLWFEVACSKGTYVRVLAEDIGAALGSAAYLDTLRRTAFGAFEIGRAVGLDTWNPGAPCGLIPLSEALAHLPALRLDSSAADAARQGRARVLEQVTSAARTDTMALLDQNGEVAAVIVKKEGHWTFGRVFRDPATLQAERPMLTKHAK